eukprot:CAMPEP_0173228812 /NCGR_PEP_ID=MMETSP1142-20121109/6746_1 /TAXON_ID=483371 /ORGANISM="non described non described, Strain CCMP2298" /LENGTH=49 /DNA_ID=CAMNT_0014157519 /DNA_START=627 /DNA_END=776 /DNA_ORIENTATION=+
MRGMRELSQALRRPEAADSSGDVWHTSSRERAALRAALMLGGAFPNKRK